MKKLIPFLVLILLMLCACSPNVGRQSIVSEADAVVFSSSDAEEEREPQRDENGVLISYSTLLSQYPYMVGWITVPGTIIDYPVVQCDDNNYFLTHDYKCEESKNGAIYLDFLVDFTRDRVSRNVVIHGHHMKSGVMFANLTKYDDIEFLKANPIVRFDSLYEENQWVIFAMMKIDAYGGEDGMPTFNFMKSSFEDDKDFASYVADIRAHSVYDTFDIVDVDSSDSIITMSTCSYEYDDFRTVLVARRLRDGENAKSFDFSSLSFSEECIMPPVWGEWTGSLEQ